MSPWLEIVLFIVGGAVGYYVRPHLAVRAHRGKQRHDVRLDILDQARASKRAAERRIERLSYSRQNRSPVAPAKAHNKTDMELQRHATALRQKVFDSRFDDVANADYYLALGMARAIERMAKADRSAGCENDLADLRNKYNALLRRRRFIVRWKAAKRQREIEEQP